MEQKPFKAGFVSIVGKPNVGKSSLMNKLVGENVSIITAKAQTTRHRIMGILNGENFQIVYSDTPGILEPKYSLHEAMMTYVKVSLEDADLILLVVELDDKFEPHLFERFQRIQVPILLLINKIDLALMFAKLVLGIDEDEVPSGGELRSFAEKFQRIIFKVWIIVSADQLTAEYFFLRNVLVMSHFGFCSRSNDWVGKRIIFFQAFR